MKGQLMSSEIDSSKLLDRASELVDLARAAGADEADAVVVRSRSQSVGVRLGKVESTESSESDNFPCASSSAAGWQAFRPIRALI